MCVSGLSKVNKKISNTPCSTSAAKLFKVVSFCLVLSVVGAVIWSILVSERGVAPLPSSAMEAEYQRLLQAEGSVGGNWLRTLNPNMKAVQGDLVWSTAEQRGVMRIMHLPKPERAQQYVVRAYDAYHAPEQGVPVAFFNKGTNEAPLLMSLQTSTSITDPYKFVLTQEPLKGEGEKQILLMVQL